MQSNLFPVEKETTKSERQKSLEVVLMKLKKIRHVLIDDPRGMFYLISAVGLLLYFLVSFRYGDTVYRWLVQENKPDIRFSDYFAHYIKVTDRAHLYENISWDAMGCFPPLAYCMYYVLYKLTAVKGSLPLDNIKAEDIPGALSVFTYYLIFCALLFFVAICIVGKNNRKRDVGIFSLLMMSAVFFGSGYMMGNSTMLVLGLLVLGLRLRDGETAFQRELGLILLAGCVALKLYPAVFGLLYLKDKRYKELLRLILYSFILLFGPFVFFGGRRGLFYWLKHITNTMHYTDYARPQYLLGIFHTLIRRFTGRDEKPLCMALAVLVCLVWTWLAWRSKSKYRTMFFLIAIMVFFPANAYRYSLSYFTVPLIFFLKEEPLAKPRWHFRPIMILYGMLFSIPIWWMLVIRMTRTYEYYTLTPVEIYLYLVVYLLIAMVMVADVSDRIRERGTKSI